MANPYAPCETGSTFQADGTSGDSRVGRLLAIILIVLFCSTPFRDAQLLMYAQGNGAFPPDGDSIIIPIIGSFLLTVILFPFAVALIWRGILGATRLQFVPRFDRFSIGWGIVSTPLCAFIIYLEYEKQALVLPYGYDTTRIGATVAYIVGAYCWWCNCIAHGRVESDEPPDAPKLLPASSLTTSSTTATG